MLAEKPLLTSTDLRTPGRVRCVDLELSEPARSIEGLDGYIEVEILVRLHGEPLGSVRLPVHHGRCRAVDVRRAALKAHGGAVIRHLIEDRIAVGLPAEGWSMRELLEADHVEPQARLPTVTVAVCTRDRSEELAVCLESLTRSDLAPFEVLVIDNAPETDATERLVKERFPWVRYLREPRPGLDWARNRAVLEARGEIVAYTDDDCVVDPGWLRALAVLFADDPAVMAVTGLVVPWELETEAQHLFERAGGFSRGFRRHWNAVDPERGLPWAYCGAGRFGTGANMAYRRTVFSEVGLFDTALDVGTVTNGGGDLDMFFRVLVEGFTLVYEPAAVIRHRHRRDYGALRKQLANNGYGFCSYLVRNVINYPKEYLRFVYLASWWLWKWQVPRVLGAMFRPTRLPLRLLALELWTGLSGFRRYSKAKRNAAKIARDYGPLELDRPPPKRDWLKRRRGQDWVGPVGVRAIEIGRPLEGLTGVERYELVKVFVTSNGRLIGSLTVPNQHRPVSARRLREAIADALGVELLAYTREGASSSAWAFAEAYLHEFFGATEPPVMQERLAPSTTVSVVIATLDRPAGLRECLELVIGQQTPRRVEVVVVDNNPGSGLTPPVVAEFPRVRLVSEPRRGLAYARNAGFLAATGDIVIATDDDVTMESDWLERLVGPFARPDVMVVTGNVLPIELETDAQQHFETYGGLGRGFSRFEVNGDWFESFRLDAVPTWSLGATANAAFRSSLFTESVVGLMDEALGPGMPSGVGEDAYLIYKALKAHHTLVYEPAAYVWHHHRASMKALRRQIYGYSKGHVAYHLTTLARDHDLRALKRLFLDLPAWRFGQIWSRLRHHSNYPLSLVALEIWGNLVGPVGLLRSRLRVRREGRSSRSAVAAEAPAASTASVEMAPLALRKAE